MNDEKKQDKKVEIKNMKTLMDETIRAEKEFKEKKFQNEMKYNKQLVSTEWNSINEKRKEQGLPPLSNQDMKKAYILNEIMYEDYEDELEYELCYNEHRRMFDVAMKYSYDILR